MDVMVGVLSFLIILHYCVYSGLRIRLNVVTCTDM